MKRQNKFNLQQRQHKSFIQRFQANAKLSITVLRKLQNSLKLYGEVY